MLKALSNHLPVPLPPKEQPDIMQTTLAQDIRAR
jgi:hypothetical protein